jgi:hypothetical protein
VTISSTSTKDQHNGNGVATSFDYNFRILFDTDLEVTRTSTSGSDTVLALNTDYSVTGVGDAAGGSITYPLSGAALASGEKLTIRRKMDFLQPVDLQNQGGFFPEVHEDAFDRGTMFSLQLEEEASRTLKAPVTDPTTIDLTLPSASSRAGTVLGFNATTGDPEAGPTIADVATLAAITADIATLADIEDGTDATDAIQTVAGISSNVTAVAGISANVTTVAGISANVTTVAGDSADIQTVATNIADVNTVAANIADVITVANDLNEAISEIETTANDLNEAVSEIDTVATSIADVNTVGTNIADVNTVAGISTNVTTVAGISANVTTVAGISSAVTTVAADGTDIGVVAGLSADIQALADIEDGTSATDAISNLAAIAGNVVAVDSNSSNINAVSGNATNINTVAGISTDVTAVAADAADIGTVAANIANINTVATDIAQIITTANDLNEAVSEIDTVATNIAAVDTVGSNIAGVNTVATNIADINTVAANVTDITNFSDVYQGAHSTAPSTRTDGSALQVGDLYFNTVEDAMKVYSSGGWVAAGSSVNGTANRYDYVVGTASGDYDGASTTIFPATYDSGYVDVWLNGAKLVPTADFTATSGTQVVLATAASSGANVCIVGYGTFELSDFSIGSANDVSLSGLANGDFLAYNGTSGNFEPTQVDASGAVTYENLNSNGDVGTGAAQVAAGDHNHSGVYEPADATILKDADIGSTVQPYDAYLPAWPSTVDATEVGYLNGVTSAIQTQLNGKAATTGNASNNFSAATLNATTVDLGNWTITESAGVLYFATSGTNKMKLDASGNMTCVGNVTAYGTV